jgi:aminomethyltransferase
VDRVITRDARDMAIGRVIYTPWCNEHGQVLDDGTVTRLGEELFRWTAAEPNLRWLRQQSAGLDVLIEDVSEQVASLALQGPTSRALLQSVVRADLGNLNYFRMVSSTIAGASVDISRTGYTGDLGYEVWMDRADATRVWDALAAAGAAFGLRPAGMLALDVARIEAGLLLIGVDFFSARSALTPSQAYSPFELGLGRLVDFNKAHFIGRGALAAEQAARPRRRIVGLAVDWPAVERLYEHVGLPPMAEATASRLAVPVYANGKQIGRMTSSTWSPVLKQMIGLATVNPTHTVPGSTVQVEHTVEAVRHRVPAIVTETPFFKPARKTATV